MSPKPVREWDRILLRLPDGMKSQVEDVAADNCMPLNSQLVQLIKRGLAAEKAASSQA